MEKRASVIDLNEKKRQTDSHILSADWSERPLPSDTNITPVACRDRATLIQAALREMDIRNICIRRQSWMLIQQVNLIEHLNT